jgi:hypothetical protein
LSSGSQLRAAGRSRTPFGTFSEKPSLRIHEKSRTDIRNKNRRKFPVRCAPRHVCSINKLNHLEFFKTTTFFDAFAPFPRRTPSSCKVWIGIRGSPGQRSAEYRVKVCRGGCSNANPSRSPNDLNFLESVTTTLFCPWALHGAPSSVSNRRLLTPSVRFSQYRAKVLGAAKTAGLAFLNSAECCLVVRSKTEYLHYAHCVCALLFRMD